MHDVGARFPLPLAPPHPPAVSGVATRPLYRSPFPPSRSAPGQARRRWGQRGGAGPCPWVLGAMDVGAAGFGRLLPGLRDRVRSAAFLGERWGPAGCPQSAPMGPPCRSCRLLGAASCWCWLRASPPGHVGVVLCFRNESLGGCWKESGDMQREALKQPLLWNDPRGKGRKRDAAALAVLRAGGEGAALRSP